MTVEGAGGRELAQLVTDHVFGHQHRNVLVAVIDAESDAHELGRMVERRDQVLITSLRPDER